jgi:hypothetical protein
MMRYFECMVAPQRGTSHRFRYTLKALIVLLTAAALLFAVLARFGIKGLFAILYCVPWVPFCWTYFEAHHPREMT